MYRLAVTAACVILVAAALAIRLSLSGSSSTYSWGTANATPPPDIASVVGSIFDEECISAPNATVELRAQLDSQGRRDWRVTEDASSKATGCVSALVLVQQREIRLTVALRPEVRQALRRVANEMLDSCLNRMEASELLTRTLQSVGETEYELRTDGPRTGPGGREAELLQHVADGCYLYGGVGFKPDGTRVYMIGGTLE